MCGVVVLKNGGFWKEKRGRLSPPLYDEMVVDRSVFQGAPTGRSSGLAKRSAHDLVFISLFLAGGVYRGRPSACFLVVPHDSEGTQILVLPRQNIV